MYAGGLCLGLKVQNKGLNDTSPAQHEHYYFQICETKG